MDEGQEVGVDEVGTLLVKGDSTAPFYWNKHRKSQQTMLGEWLNTGDKFRCDAEGFHWYRPGVVMTCSRWVASGSP